VCVWCVCAGGEGDGKEKERVASFFLEEGLLYLELILSEQVRRSNALGLAPRVRAHSRATTN